MDYVYFTSTASAEKTGRTRRLRVDGRLVKFAEITLPGAHSQLKYSMVDDARNPFGDSGGLYLMSLYVYADTVDFWWCPRGTGGGVNGHGAIQCKANQITRVSYVLSATNSYTVDMGNDPEVAWGSGSPNTNLIFLQCNANPAPATVWIGGLMLEPLPPDYKDGIALIGDSTMAGGSGAKDFHLDFNDPTKREASTILASELKTCVFNRAAGGERLDQMDDRWATDISPLAHRCRDVIIQGGLNDFGQGRTAEQALANVASMVAKAEADGFSRAIVMTCSYGSTIAADEDKTAERAAYNAAVLSTYTSSQTAGGMALDSYEIRRVATDDVVIASSDGVHYTAGVETAVGADMAASIDWSWIRQPSTYIPVQS